jgi:hypothetical protein
MFWAATIFGVLAVALAGCPCGNESYCKPLTHPPNGPELFVFTVTPGAWKAYNFTYLTTIAVFYDLANDPALVCSAHMHGVRVVMLASGFNLDNLTNSDATAAWVASQV